MKNYLRRAENRNFYYYKLIPLWLVFTLLILVITLRLNFPIFIITLAGIIPWVVCFYIIYNLKCPDCGFRTIPKPFRQYDFTPHFTPKVREPYVPLNCKQCGFRYDP